MQPHSRFATCLSSDFYLLPAHPSANAGAKRLGSRLFRGKARREALRAGLLFAQAVLNFSRREDAFKKAMPESGNALFDPLNLGQICT